MLVPSPKTNEKMAARRLIGGEEEGEEEPVCVGSSCPGS